MLLVMLLVLQAIGVEATTKKVHTEKLELEKLKFQLKIQFLQQLIIRPSTLHIFEKEEWYFVIL